MSTHIAAKEGQIADVVLLPGDPLRAQFIAENYLQNAECYTQIRGMLGFTGTYKGKKVSVQGTGMGQPSLSIYVNELFRFYGVQRAIRIGTCGGIQPHVKLRDVIVSMTASSDSGMAFRRFGPRHFAPHADFSLLVRAVQAAEKSGAVFHVGQVVSSDMFYDDACDWKLWAEYGVLGVEMEAAELYTLAAQFKRKALAILTVSDHIATGEASSAEERQTTFRTMMEIALETAVLT